MATEKPPVRVPTDMSEGEEAVPDGSPADTLGLLSERLRAYKHMCGYLEGYIEAVSKEEKSNAKDQEKVLKSISKPLREGHHFDQATGGVASLFENLRSNTSAIANMHAETSKNLDGSVLPILTRLHQEIKNKDKELEKGAGKGAKAVLKAKNESQKFIELLGTHSANFDSAGAKITAHNDPYVIQRGIHHRLNKQIIEENNNRQDIIAVQDNFQQFEAHVLTVVKTALATFQQLMAGQSDRSKAIYGDVTATANAIPLDFEWKGFVHRNGEMLINAAAPPRTMTNITFPNQGHRSTKALIEGSLERKSRMALKGYSPGYYSVTPAGYLHEFKDNDDFRRDPTPEISLYLPNCTVGAIDGTKFAVRGKDTSGGAMGSKIAKNTDYNFKAHTAEDAKMWHDIIAEKATGAGSIPSSPKMSPVTTTEGSIEAAAQQPLTAEEKEFQQAKEMGQIDSSVQSADMAGTQQSGVVRSASQMAHATPVSATTEATHFHGAPGETTLTERKFNERDG